MPPANTSGTRFSLQVVIIFSLLALPGQVLPASKIEQQRQIYVDAKKALQAGRLKQFRKLAGSIQDYPLYPYLLSSYLQPRLWKIKDDEIIRFLKKYGDLPMAENIHTSWLKILARRGKWKTFLENYTPQKDISLQCFQLQARIKTGSETYLLEDTRTIWLAGESQPPECDAAFARLYESELMTPALIWQRIALAMDKGNVSLAKYLSYKLSANDQAWMGKWIAMHHNPARWIPRVDYADTDLSRNIIVHGMKRFTRVSLDQTITHWHRLKPAYAFTTAQKNAVEKTLAIKAAIKRDPRSIRLLDELDKTLIDEGLFQWRLRAALEQEDWRMLLNWTTGNPPNEDVYSRWLFWHARALHELGDRVNAADLLATLAKERDYYGFRAADRVGRAYRLNHHPLPEDIETWQKMAELPAILRARELYILRETYPARREWHHALESMTTYEMQIAAGIASSWGWHDRTILTLGRARAWDDLVLRFPLSYEERIRQYALKRDVDLGWMYALVRAESAFIEEVRSPAGALGLMQVMPETGKVTAKSIGYRSFYTSMLMNEKHNVAIGSAYLRQMYDRFNGNVVLATAAYNAGPGNVTRWLPKDECEDPEIWIEKIPYDETRKYVRRILYFASIYDWRLRRDIVPIADRMNKTIPTKKQLVAKLECDKPARFAQN